MMMLVLGLPLLLALLVVCTSAIRDEAAQRGLIIAGRVMVFVEVALASYLLMTVFAHDVGLTLDSAKPEFAAEIASGFVWDFGGSGAPELRVALLLDRYSAFCLWVGSLVFAGAVWGLLTTGRRSPLLAVCLSSFCFLAAVSSSTTLALAAAALLHSLGLWFFERSIAESVRSELVDRVIVAFVASDLLVLLAFLWAGSQFDTFEHLALVDALRQGDGSAWGAVLLCLAIACGMRLLLAAVLVTARGSLRVGEAHGFAQRFARFSMRMTSALVAIYVLARFAPRSSGDGIVGYASVAFVCFIVAMSVGFFVDFRGPVLRLAGLCRRIASAPARVERGFFALAGHAAQLGASIVGRSSRVIERDVVIGGYRGVALFFQVLSALVRGAQNGNVFRYLLIAAVSILILIVASLWAV